MPNSSTGSPKLTPSRINSNKNKQKSNTLIKSSTLKTLNSYKKINRSPNSHKDFKTSNKKLDAFKTPSHKITKPSPPSSPKINNFLFNYKPLLKTFTHSPVDMKKLNSAKEKSLKEKLKKSTKSIKSANKIKDKSLKVWEPKSINLHKKFSNGKPKPNKKINTFTNLKSNLKSYSHSKPKFKISKKNFSSPPSPAKGKYLKCKNLKKRNKSSWKTFRTHKNMENLLKKRLVYSR